MMKLCAVGAISIGSLVVSAVLPAHAAATEAVELKAGAHVFLIPETNSMERRLPSWLSWIPGLDDDSDSISLVFRETELALSVQGYRTTGIDVFATLAVLDAEEIRRYADSGRFKDAWSGLGAFADRRIEAIEGTSMYRIFRGGEKNFWVVVNQYPDASKPIPSDPMEFFVARCTHLGPKAKVQVTCDTYVSFDDIAIDFHLKEENLPVVNQLREFMRAKATSWMRAAAI